MRCCDKAQLTTLLQVKIIPEYLMGQYYNTSYISPSSIYIMPHNNTYSIDIAGKVDNSSKLYLAKFLF